MRKVIYTCFTGNYDTLKQPLAVRPDWDYICFSDTLPLGRNGAWDVRPIPFDCPDSVVRSRYVKLLPHKALPEYDWSLWLDANIRITGDGLYDALEEAIASGTPIAQVSHPFCDCIWDEVRNCYHLSRIDYGTALRCRSGLRREGMPHGWGMFENNVILRRHGDPEVIAVSERWWEKYLGLGRDQLCLMDIYFEKGMRPAFLFGEGRNAHNVPFLEYQPHPGSLRVEYGFFRRKWRGLLEKFL